MDSFPDHGVAHGDQHKARDYLYHNNWVAFVVIITAIILAQFIFQVLYEGINYIMGNSEDEELLRALIITTLLIGGIFLAFIYIIFKIPMAAAFTY